MTNNFWFQIKKPILALAPMAGFTDSSFRMICKKFGADVVYSEMASTTALYYQQQHKIDATIRLLKFKKKEKPYVVQLFGSNPDHFAQAAQFITQEIKPSGIDINFGCPVNKVMKQGAGAALMQDLDRSYKVIKAVLDNTSLPVSVKIRAQSGSVSALDFVKKISDLNVSAIMIHGRSLGEGFAGKPDWSFLPELRKVFKGIILLNGGINNLEQAQKALFIEGVDGLGLARGILRRPWLFAEIKKNKKMELTKKEIFSIILKHSKKVYKEKGEAGIVELRKHLCWYVQGLEGAKKLRSQFVQVNNIRDIKKIIKKIYDFIY